MIYKLLFYSATNKMESKATTKTTFTFAEHNNMKHPVKEHKSMKVRDLLQKYNFDISKFTFADLGQNIPETLVIEDVGPMDVCVKYQDYENLIQTFYSFTCFSQFLDMNVNMETFYDDPFPSSKTPNLSEKEIAERIYDGISCKCEEPDPIVYEACYLGYLLLAFHNKIEKDSEALLLSKKLYFEECQKAGVTPKEYEVYIDRFYYSR